MAVVQNGFALMQENYKAHYEDVIAYFLRYPEVMFEGNMTLPIFPEDFNDAYGYYLSEKGKYATESTTATAAPTIPTTPITPTLTTPTTPTLTTPEPRNYNRGPDVGYQNLFIEKYEPASDKLIPTYGPLRLVDLVPKLLAIKDSKTKQGYRPPFIRISLKSLAMANKLNIIGSEYRQSNPETPMDNLFEQDVVDQIALKLNISGYVPLGDILFARNVAHQNKTFTTSSATTPKHFPFAVFAHRDICTSVPVDVPVSFSDSNNMVKGYRANMFHESITMDIRAMYADVGYTLNSSYKYVVMRCFLSQEITDSIDKKFDITGFAESGCGRFEKFPTFKSKNAFEMRTYKKYKQEYKKGYGYCLVKYKTYSDMSCNYIEYDPKFVYISQSNNVVNINDNVIYKFLPSPEAAISNLADVITENSTQVNRIFQGVNSKINDVVQRIDSVAYMFAKQLCSVASLNIDGYPDLCACIGQGRLAEIRLLLKNSAYRPECHDGKCLDLSDKKVFRLKYQPLPCNKTSICSRNVTLDANRLNLRNVKFDCQFKDEELDESNKLSSITALGPADGSRRFVYFLLAGLCVFLFIAALILK